MTEDIPRPEVAPTLAQSSRHKVYMACQFCPCVEDWVMKAPFLCRKDAAEYCDLQMRLAVREARPIEYWHVRRFDLYPCEGEVVWGCCHAHQADDAEAPNCV